MKLAFDRPLLLGITAAAALGIALTRGLDVPWPWSVIAGLVAGTLMTHGARRALEDGAGE